MRAEVETCLKSCNNIFIKMVRLVHMDFCSKFKLESTIWKGNFWKSCISFPEIKGSYHAYLIPNGKLGEELANEQCQ